MGLQRCDAVREPRSRRVGGCRCTRRWRGGGSFRYSWRLPAVVGPGVAIRSARGGGGPAGSEEAAPLLRGERLNRLGTLTYAGAGCHDPYAVRGHVGSSSGAAGLLGGEAFPYAWVPEWHKGGHGLHLHFAVGRYVRRHLIEQAWGRGFVHIKLLGDLPVGSGRWGGAGRCPLPVEVRRQGFEQDASRGCTATRWPRGSSPFRCWSRATPADAALDAACEVMGGRPVTGCGARGERGLAGPPAVWASWPG
jgi:hypothetical protein